MNDTQSESVNDKSDNINSVNDESLYIQSVNDGLDALAHILSTDHQNANKSYLYLKYSDGLVSMDNSNSESSSNTDSDSDSDSDMISTTNKNKSTKTKKAKKTKKKIKTTGNLRYCTDYTDNIRSKPPPPKRNDNNTLHNCITEQLCSLFDQKLTDLNN